MNPVERFYDFHPINARQILDAVAARGIAPDAITEEVLQQHDQDHYGGTAATDRPTDRGDKPFVRCWRTKSSSADRSSASSGRPRRDACAASAPRSRA